MPLRTTGGPWQQHVLWEHGSPADVTFGWVQMPPRPELDNWALGLCDTTAQRSRDPQRQVGCVILRPDKTVAAAGYNGFPRRVCDDPGLYEDRDAKLHRMIHAELAAILTAREPLEGYTLYVNRMPCSHCAACIIQKGISRVVTAPPPEQSRWLQSWQHARAMFHEANVLVDYISIHNDNITNSS